eukprot:1966482-Pyramimonas_sp.AAC.2
MNDREEVGGGTNIVNYIVHQMFFDQLSTEAIQMWAPPDSVKQRVRGGAAQLTFTGELITLRSCR